VPTKTHRLAASQLTALIAVRALAGAEVADQVAPPSALVRTREGIGPMVEPAALQFDPRTHVMTLSAALATGIVTGVQVTPPSRVTTSNAADWRFWATAGLGPSATQVVTETHETDRKTPVPPFTARALQVLAPSLLTTIEAPTATQNVALGQSTEPRAPTDAGTENADHVVPPLEDESRFPAKGPFEPGDTPTLTHSVNVGQLTLNNVVSALESVTADHVVPPFVDRTEVPRPTATHCETLGQSTASNVGSPAANEPWVHVRPRSREVDATPRSAPSAPTATHSVTLGHETPLNPPWPTEAPPEIGTTGADV
jgi:hypothetical protein